MVFKGTSDYFKDNQKLSRIGQDIKNNLQQTVNALHSKDEEVLQEKILIGYILLNSEVVLEVNTIFKNNKVFIDKVNERLYNSIYNTVASLQKRNENVSTSLSIVDVITTYKYDANDLELNELQTKGADKYLSECIALVQEYNHDKAITSAKIIWQNYQKRVTVDELTDMIATLEQSDNELISSTLEKIKAKILELETETQNGLQSPKILTDKYLNDLRDIYLGIKADNEISTGYKKLDETIGGLRGGELIIVGGRPGMGKTTFVLNLVTNIIQKYKDSRIAYFSLEMSYRQLYDKIISNRLRLSSNKIRRRDSLSREEYEAITQELGNIQEEHLYIDDEEGTILNNIENSLERLFDEQKRLDLVVVDYLQLIESVDGTGGLNRERLVATVSRRLKMLAQKYDVPVIALTQLNRGLENRQNKRPMLSDIRESGSIEQDADIVMFVYRDDYYTDEEQEQVDETQKEIENNPFESTVVKTDEKENKQDSFMDILQENDEAKEVMNNSLDAGALELIVAKNRSGGLGTVPLIMIKNYSLMIEPHNNFNDNKGAK